MEQDAWRGGMLAAPQVKGVGLRTSPMVPLAICKGHQGLPRACPMLLLASPACGSSTRAALWAPSPLLLTTLARGGMDPLSSVLSTWHRREAVTSPCSCAPVVHIKFHTVTAGAASGCLGTAKVPPWKMGTFRNDVRRCQPHRGCRVPGMQSVKSTRTSLRRRCDVQVHKSVTMIILLLIVIHFLQRRQAYCPHFLPLDCVVQWPYTFPPQSGQTICIT